MRQATHQKHGPTPPATSTSNNNLLLQNGMLGSLDQQMQHQQQMQQQQQGAYDVLDTVGYCSPSSAGKSKKPIIRNN